jgi:crotonobetainyl-CoA:carnitine CoA-transferase CaiB-like acyl-CoA transferase
MDTYGLAQDLLDEKYHDLDTFRQSIGHFNDVIAEFLSHIDLEEAWQGGQQRGFPWGAIRTMDEIVGDPHLEDRDFFTDVDHQELGRSFTYPGPAAIYNGSPWSISRRAPLIGEHNQEIYCGELGLSRQELSLLAEAGAI